MTENTNNSSLIFIYITCPDSITSEKIADYLINKDLIACANIFPEITSICKWKNKKQTDKESVLILKTSKNNFTSIESEVRKLHPYTCPCIISIPTNSVNSDYMGWINNQLLK